MDPIKEALTFDDVTLAPKYSEILPSEVNTETKLSKNLSLKIPLLSSAMDTVTESRLAISMAQAGGIGVIQQSWFTKTGCFTQSDVTMNQCFKQFILKKSIHFFNHLFR